MHRPTALNARATATATLLSLAACAALMLEQVRVPFHLALHEHCVTHDATDCDTTHEHDNEHTAASTASHYDLHHPGETPEDHCPRSLADHLGELPQQAPTPPTDHSLLALAPTAQAATHAPSSLGEATLPRPRILRPPPPPRPAAPRGPPSLV